MTVSDANLEQAAIYAWEAAPSSMVGCFRLWNEVPENEKADWRKIALAARQPTQQVPSLPVDEAIDQTGYVYEPEGQVTDDVERLLSALSDDECMICGKTRKQHHTGSGVGMCQIYPIFRSRKAAFSALIESARTALATEKEK